jgi:hypothetical protein
MLPTHLDMSSINNIVEDDDASMQSSFSFQEIKDSELQ